VSGDFSSTLFFDTLRRHMEGMRRVAFPLACLTLAIVGTPSTTARLVLKARVSDGWLRWRVSRLGNKALVQIRDDLR